MPDQKIIKFGDLVAKADDPAGETFTCVMSDGSVDRLGDIIEPDGWSITKFRSNPVALYGHDNYALPIGRWEKVRVEGGKLLGQLRLAKTAFAEAVRELIASKMLNAVSVGFQPLIPPEPIEGSKRGGYRYLKQELLECSVVAVPANANALIQRSLDRFPADVRTQLLAATGNRQPQATQRGLPATPGVIPPHNGPKKMATLAERIQASQDELIALQDLQVPLHKKVQDGEEFTAEEQTEFDRIEVEKAALTKRLDTLRATERSLGLAASTREQQHRPATPAILPNGLLQRQPGGSKDRPMDLLVRMATLHFKSYVSRRPIEVLRAEVYPDRADMDAVIKAVTNPAQTTVAGWAAELVSTAIDDLLTVLTPISVYADLSGRGTRFTFGRNGVIKIPRRNKVKNAPGDLRGAFVGEGQPIPVRRGSFGSVSLTPHKMGVISDFTREMAQHSTPAIENLIREGIVEDTADAIDTALLDAVPGDAVRPAGLLNGVTPIAGAAGGGIAAMTADIAAALAPFITANAADRLIWLINPANVFKLQWASTAVGVYPFRDQISAGNIGGIPFIQSTNVPATVLILLRFADFASSTADTPEFDVSDVATLHEEDGTYPADQSMRPPGAPATTVLPIVDGAGVAAKPVRSLWQTASVAIRMLLDMDWAMRRAGMVQEVTGITW